MIPFTTGSVTKKISATTSSARVQIECNAHVHSLRIFNDSAVTVFINFGESAVTAATTDFPIGAGMTEVVSPSLGARNTYIAAITASGTGTIYFTPGQGI